MAEVVESDLGQPGAFKSWSERSDAHVAGVEGPANFVREDETEINPHGSTKSVLGLDRSMLPQGLHRGGGEQNEP
jgi:hypothetical protein